MIHLAGPAILIALLAGTGVFGILARRNAVLVLIGAELLLAAAGVLFVLATTLPAGGLAALGDLPAARTGATGGSLDAGPAASDPLVSGQVATIMLITVAAAEIGLALAVVLLLFRARSTTDLAEVRELGEGAPRTGSAAEPVEEIAR